MDIAERFTSLVNSIEGSVRLDCDMDSQAKPTKECETTEENAACDIVQCETDVHRIRKRARQIEIGKNTTGYSNFIRKYPRYAYIHITLPANVNRRNSRPKDGPWTPQKYQKCSTRSWAGQVQKWRRLLHQYDNL